ncbi:hypothetical protein D3C84_1084150 [compost metagenome]
MPSSAPEPALWMALTNFADFAASVMSAASGKANAMPATVPLTAQMIGCGKLRISTGSEAITSIV